MAVTMEQVERLREKSGATYEECRDALERTDGNLLDAIILLERAGRSRTAGATFTTKPGEKAAEAARLVLSPESGQSGGKKRSDWRDGAAEVWEAVNKGETLVNAYTAYAAKKDAEAKDKRIKELESALEAEKQAKKNAARSTGSQKSDGGETPYDPIAAGWNSV